MPQELRNLIISEVSLVDVPANSETDPVTGQKIPRSSVAIWKRDTSKETKTMQELPKLSQILKSDTATRAQICGAVRRKAVKIAKKRGISIEKAESRIWRKNPEAALAYENASLPVAKQAERFITITKAEVELDKRARRRMQRTGESYASAVGNELKCDPSLYGQYEREKVNNGPSFPVRDSVEYLGIPGQADNKMDASDYTDDDEDEDEDGDEDGDESGMLARRPQSTTNNDMTDQERKNKNKMRR